MSSYYEILQVDPRADQEVIDAAYHRLIRKYHPDVNPSSEAARMARHLNEIYSVLRDPKKRAEYDEWLRQTQNEEEKNSQTNNLRSKVYLCSACKEPVPEDALFCPRCGKKFKAPEESTRPRESKAADQEDLKFKCQRCGRIDSTLRLSLFRWVVSVIFVSYHKKVQRLLCSRCRYLESFGRTLFCLILGPWGIPFGIAYALEAIFLNPFGGEQPKQENFDLLYSLSHQLYKANRKREALRALEYARQFKKGPDLEKVIDTLKRELGLGPAYRSSPFLGWGRGLVPIVFGICCVLLIFIGSGIYQLVNWRDSIYRNLNSSSSSARVATIAKISLSGDERCLKMLREQVITWPRSSEEVKLAVSTLAAHNMLPAVIEIRKELNKYYLPESRFNFLFSYLVRIDSSNAVSLMSTYIEAYRAGEDSLIQAEQAVGDELDKRLGFTPEKAKETEVKDVTINTEELQSNLESKYPIIIKERKLAVRLRRGVTELADIESEEARWFIVKAVSCHDSIVSMNAINILKNQYGLTTIDILFGYMAKKPQFSQNEYELYINLLKSFGQSGGVRISECLKKEYSEVGGQPEEVYWMTKYCALKALQDIGTSETIPALKLYANDPDVIVHEQRRAEQKEGMTRPKITITRTKIYLGRLARETINKITSRRS